MIKKACVANTPQEVIVNPLKIENLTVLKIIDIQTDKRLFERFLKANTSFVMNVVKKYGNYHHISDDLFQVGTIGLHNAIQKYDVQKCSCSGFSGYAYTCIDNSIRQLLEKEKDWYDKVSNFETISEKFKTTIGETYSHEDATDNVMLYFRNKFNLSRDFETEIVHKIEFADFLDKIEKTYQDIVRYRVIEGMNHKDVAEYLGMSYYVYKTIWNKGVIPLLIKFQKEHQVNV